MMGPVQLKKNQLIDCGVSMTILVSALSKDLSNLLLTVIVLTFTSLLF